MGSPCNMHEAFTVFPFWEARGRRNDFHRGLRSPRVLTNGDDVKKHLLTAGAGVLATAMLLDRKSVV